jgi:hypothetical protein
MRSKMSTNGVWTHLYNSPPNQPIRLSSMVQFILLHINWFGVHGPQGSANFSYGWSPITGIGQHVISLIRISALYEQEDETTHHLLSACVFARQFWHQLFGLFGLSVATPPANNKDLFAWWQQAQNSVSSTICLMESSRLAHFLGRWQSYRLIAHVETYVGCFVFILGMYITKVFS